MKVKVFHIRLTKENLQADQDNLNDFLDSVSIKKLESELITGQPNFWSILVFFEEKNADLPKSSNKIAVTAESELTEDEKLIYNALRQWRNDKANNLNLPSYVIAHNTQLMTIAKVKPQTLDDFINIKGFGGLKVAKYGEDIIALLNSI